METEGNCLATAYGNGRELLEQPLYPT